MSSDFMNFGATTLNIMGTTAIIGEEAKMLRNISRNGGPHKCRHCGSLHPTRAALTAHYRYEHPPKKMTEGGHASHRDDWEFDFRI